MNRVVYYRLGGPPIANEDIMHLQQDAADSALASALYLASAVNLGDMSIPVAVNGCDIIPSGGGTTVKKGMILWQPSGYNHPLLLPIPEDVELSTTGETLDPTEPSNIYVKIISASADEVLIDRFQDISLPAISMRTYEDAGTGTQDILLYYYLSVVGTEPSDGTYFRLDELRYGGAPIGKIEHLDLDNAGFDALGFQASGWGTGFYNGWKIRAELAGRALIGQGEMSGGDTYNAQDEIGSERVTLDGTELPAHQHGIIQIVTPAPDSSKRIAFNNSDANNYGLNFTGLTNIYGGTLSHENRGPRYVVYMIRKER